MNYLMNKDLKKVKHEDIAVQVIRLETHIPLQLNEIRKLRGAIVEVVEKNQMVFKQAGISTDLFHNHLSTNIREDRSFDYPLIQYKVKHRKASIVGIGAGVKAIKLLVALLEQNISINNEIREVVIDRFHQTAWTPELKGLQYYRINKWLPLSVENYEKWNRCVSLVEKAQLLDHVLWGHIQHLIKGVSKNVNKEGLKLVVHNIDMQTYKKCYRIKKLALDVVIATNLNLPDEIGLGQGVSIGFGKVQRIKKKE